MSKVTVCGETRIYPANTTLQQIARDFQQNFTSEIVLVVHNGKLRELRHTIHDGGTLSFITTADKAGASTYERSVIFMMVNDPTGKLANCAMPIPTSTSIMLQKRSKSRDDSS